MATLASYLAPDSTADIAEIGAWLDGLDHAGRVAELSTTTPKQQRKLWDLAAHAAPLTLDHFVPAGVADTTEVIHEGRNTLPVFQAFQKRFCRAADGSGRIFGYNEGVTRALIGPGYFVLRSTEGESDVWQQRGGVVVDYFLKPDGAVPTSWPKVRANSVGLQIFVYYHTRDFMRRVSAHVSIGHAWKNESEMGPAYFTLCREDR